LGLWLIIPLGWHAIFLTGSRGGLIGLAVTILLIAMRSRQQRLLGLLLIPAFIIAYQWQAGGLMKERAETISDYDTETSASSRLEAWSAALNMIVDHPLTGVGLASFGPAFPHYSEEKPREAHNTFLQITAESGILAGTMYVLIAVSSIVGLWRHGNRLHGIKSETGANVLYLINEATLVALCGLLVCSAFLSLQVFEIFYCLCLVVNAVLYIGRKSGVDQHQIQMTQPTTVGPVR
jgi:O-antigen ligase